MSDCPICSAPVTSKDPYVFFCGNNGADICCCSRCEMHMKTIMDSENASEFKASINYFYGHLDRITDNEVRFFVNEMIESNAEAIHTMGKKATQKRGDYFENRAETEKREAANKAHFWQNSMACVSWIIFMVLLLAGVTLGLLMMRVSFLPGLLMMTGIGLIAFLVHASIMVFIGMAEDIRLIRIKTNNK